MSLPFLIYIVSVLWCIGLIIFGIRQASSDGVKLTPFHVVILFIVTLLAFSPFFNTCLAVICSFLVLCMLDEEGYFDKFKEWWNTPIFKDKE